VLNVIRTSEHISCGVPQGSVLGPLLFVMYTTSLSTLISSLSLNHHHLYADLQGVKVPVFPLTLLVIVTTVLRYHTACDTSFHFVLIAHGHKYLEMHYAIPTCVMLYFDNCAEVNDDTALSVLMMLILCYRNNRKRTAH